MNADDWLPPLPDDELVLPPLPDDDDLPPLPSDEITYEALDSETFLIQPALLAPKPVCFSFAHRTPTGIQSSLVTGPEGVTRFRYQLVDPNKIIVIHNAPFDVAVAVAQDPSLILPVFDAYRAHRIRCTIVRQKLIDIALGMRDFRHVQRDGQWVVLKTTYHLADLVLHYYNEHLEKKDTWRLSYALLDGVSLDRWPSNAREYATKDAVEHLRVYEAQDRLIAEKWGELPNQVEQQQAAWALYLMSMWGVRADPVAVDKFISHCQVEISKMHSDLAETGIFQAKYRCTVKCKFSAAEPFDVCPVCGKQGKCRANKGVGTRVMDEIKKRVVAACERQQVVVPMTPPSAKYPEGQVKMDKKALEATDDPALHVLATQMTFVKHLGQWGPVCKAAVHRPVCARYEVLVETGRTACSGGGGQEGTNFQNPPRAGDVRPCFVPRRGWLFCSTDADTIELRAHAQNCLEIVGHSKMAEALWDQHKNKGPDLHVRLAANIMGIDHYVADARKKEGDAEVSLARQFAKIPNFGFPGGLGPETMVTYAAAQLNKKMHEQWFGTDREEQIQRATRLREIWFRTWPENKRYFKEISKMIGDGNSGTIRQLVSNRIRGDARFTAVANGFFQGRVADAEKDILFYLGDECYTGRCTSKHTHGGSNLCTVQGRSVLFGSRPLMFLHDEPILEHPEDGSESNRAERQRQVVVEHLSKWLPAIPCTSTAVLMRRWQKNAEALFVDGKLVPVKPEKVVGTDGKTKVKWVEDRL